MVLRGWRIRNIFKGLLNIAFGFGALYGLCVSIFLAIRSIFGEVHHFIEYINGGLHWHLILASFLCSIALMTKRWRSALTLLPPTAVFAALYAPVFIPRSTPQPSLETKTLTVLTFNLHSERSSVEPLFEVIREANADVVVLQEMSRSAAQGLPEQFAQLYPYQKLHANRAHLGRGVLSRYPITADEVWHYGYPDGIRLQRVEIGIQGTEVTLYNFHATPSYEYWRPYDPQKRGREIEELLSYATAEAGSVILAGDFNVTNLQDDYQRLIQAGFKDSYRESGYGFGWTAPDWSAPNSRPRTLRLRSLSIPWLPLTRIDYVFHNDQIRALESHVWPTSGGSDHRPVLARLVLLPTN